MSGTDRPVVDVVEFEWVAPHLNDESAMVDRFLAALRESFPELLPRRYDVDGAGERYADFSWEHRDQFFEATNNGGGSWQLPRPFFSARISRMRGGRRPGPTPLVTVAVGVERDVFYEPATHVHVLNGLGAIADAIGAFYAYGRLARGLVIMDDGCLTTRAGMSYAPRDFILDMHGWLGLPRRAVVLEWFGPPYLPLIGERVVRQGHPLAGGLLAEYSGHG